MYGLRHRCVGRAALPRGSRTAAAARRTGRARAGAAGGVRAVRERGADGVRGRARCDRSTGSNLLLPQRQRTCAKCKACREATHEGKSRRRGAGARCLHDRSAGGRNFCSSICSPDLRRKHKDKYHQVQGIHRNCNYSHNVWVAAKCQNFQFSEEFTTAQAFLLCKLFLLIPVQYFCCEIASIAKLWNQATVHCPKRSTSDLIRFFQLLGEGLESQEDHPIALAHFLLPGLRFEPVQDEFAGAASCSEYEHACRYRHFQVAHCTVAAAQRPGWTRTRRH